MFSLEMVKEQTKIFPMSVCINVVFYIHTYVFHDLQEVSFA